MIILFHPTGNANVRETAYGLIKQNLLAEFHVGVAPFPGSILDRLGDIKLFSEIKRRRFELILKPFTKTYPFFEFGRMLAPKLGFAKLARNKNSPFNIDNVVKNLDRNVALQLKNIIKNGVSAVYGYEDCTLFTFREAQRIGLKRMYDLPIGYWRAMHRHLEKERELWPDWASTLTGFSDDALKLARKDEELRLADCIFVASSFTANTLKEFPGELGPVKIIPYGFPCVNLSEKNYLNFKRQRPLKLLFVGSLSQRKGIANLFAAVEKLSNYVELTIVGYKTTNDCPALDTALAKHKWIPTLSHDKVLKLMRESDVLVFPSLFEGFGLVITEAMSQGIPVITTERTAGPDIIKHGQNGWLIEAGSTQSLQTAIEELLYYPERISEVGCEAMKTAYARPWEVYGHDIAKSAGNAIRKESQFQNKII